MARAQLERGLNELKQGHLDSALGSLSASRELDDTFAVENAIADATALLGKPVEAHAGYAAFVERHRPTLSAEQLSIAQAKLGELAAGSAQLKLAVSEIDAEVSIDGAAVGRSPLTEALLQNPGPHQISLKKPGFVALTQQFVLTRGVNELSMALVPEVLTGKLHVETSSPGVAELLIDNQVVGLLPWEGTLPVGKATLIARTTNQTSTPLDVVVERDVTKPVSIQLIANEGTLDVSSAAVGVRVSIDGRKVGTQNWRGTLPVGTHHLLLERPAFIAQEQDVQIQAGSVTSIVVGHWVAAPVLVDEAPKNDRGLYFRLDLAGMFGGSGNGMSQQCDSKDTVAPARCAAKNPVGGSLGLRVGYRFNWIAPELFGLGTFAVSYVRSQFDKQDTPLGADPFYGPTRREDYVFFRYGWAAGAAVRVTTPTSGVAATGALGFGVFSENGSYARSTMTSTKIPVVGTTVPDVQTHSSNTVTTYSPGLVLGRGRTNRRKPRHQAVPRHHGANRVCPGARAQPPPRAVNSEQAPRPSPSNFFDYGTPGLDIVSGTQFRFGPVLGFQFGY